ncbi:hypothetical protein [Candidatus Nitrotoga sp. BS]|uniref:hypothetical protein n=1 Tax=Candidatus Nitrotoga sp. BS TaxID=2890408 RepID=UPI001EF29BA9|nr:hypothetical protein [Candidatus Nitrotoga sp. BS]
MLLTTPGCDQDTTEEALYQGQAIDACCSRSMIEQRCDTLSRTSNVGRASVHALA